MSDTSGSGLTVIVVDDCEDIRLMLRVMLEMRGYFVLEAEHGQEAVDLAKQACPNLILMDLNMPVPHCHMFFPLLRMQSSTGFTPPILMCNYVLHFKIDGIIVSYLIFILILFLEIRVEAEVTNPPIKK